MVEIIIYVVAGVGLIIYSIITLSKLFNYKRVIAECIDVDEDRFSTNDTSSKEYKSKYRFSFGSEDVIASENHWLGNKVHKYRSYTIFFNPKNPTKILTISQIISNIYFFVFGIIIVLVYIIDLLKY